MTTHDKRNLFSSQWHAPNLHTLVSIRFSICIRACSTDQINSAATTLPPALLIDMFHVNSLYALFDIRSSYSSRPRKIWRNFSDARSYTLTNGFRFILECRGVPAETLHASQKSFYDYRGGECCIYVVCRTVVHKLDSSSITD